MNYRTFMMLFAFVCACSDSVASAQGFFIVQQQPVSPISVRPYQPGEPLFWTMRENVEAGVRIVHLTGGTAAVIEVPEGSVASLCFKPGIFAPSHPVVNLSAGTHVVCRLQPGQVQVQGLYVSAPVSEPTVQKPLTIPAPTVQEEEEWVPVLPKQKSYDDETFDGPSLPLLPAPTLAPSILED